MLDYRSFWSIVDDNFCIVDMHKGNLAEFFGAQSEGTNIFFFFCGTEPTPQSKRRSQGHRHFIHQASFFDTKETFDTTQKPFKSSDFCRRFAFGRKCGCVSIKTSPFLFGCLKNPTPLDSEKSGRFFIKHFSPHPSTSVVGRWWRYGAHRRVGGHGRSQRSGGRFRHLRGIESEEVH